MYKSYTPESINITAFYDYNVFSLSSKPNLEYSSSINKQSVILLSFKQNAIMVLMVSIK